MLDSYEILDSAAEKSYDDIARLAAHICATQAALISFFDHDRLWIKARFGNAAFFGKSQNLPGNAAFCEVAIQEPDRVTVVPDMSCDSRFADHPLIIGSAKMRFYAAVPLTDPAGMVLGTLSVLDRRSRTLTPNQTSALETLGRQVNGVAGDAPQADRPVGGQCEARPAKFDRCADQDPKPPRL